MPPIVDSLIASGGSTSGGLVAAAALAVAGLLAVLARRAALGLGSRRAAAALGASAARFRTVTDPASDALVLHREGTLIEANDAARALLDLGGADVTGRTLPRLEGLAEAFGAGDGTARVELLTTAAGRVPVELRRRGMQPRRGPAVEVLALTDLSARHEAAARLLRAERSDPLTGLAHRARFAELALATLADARAEGGAVSLTLVQLHGLSHVNATWGQEAGDEVVRTAARRLANACGPHAVAGRLAGAEFGILTRGAAPDARGADGMRDALSLPVMVARGAEAAVGVAIASAAFPADGRALETLWRKADAALREVAAPRTRGARGTAGPGRDARHGPPERATLEARLRVAVETCAFELVYQPIVDCGSRRPTGAEALLRWHDAELGPVSPAVFVPVAERTGLIVALGRWVLGRACCDAASWPSGVRVAVNVSAAQYAHAGFTDTVAAALHESGLAPARLELEIGAAALAGDGAGDAPDGAANAHARLRALGVSLATDEPGADRGAFDALRRRPVDRLKVSRRHVSNVDGDAHRSACVAAAVATGAALTARVAAEGVETEAEATALARLGCDELQGYLVSRPLPAAEVARWFVASR